MTVAGPGFTAVILPKPSMVLPPVMLHTPTPPPNIAPLAVAVVVPPIHKVGGGGTVTEPMAALVLTVMTPLPVVVLVQLLASVTVILVLS